MDQLDIATHQTIHESDVPAKEIATRIGMGYQILLNKGNPDNEYHKLSLREAISIQLVTKSHAIHDAAGLILGIHGLPIRSPRPDNLITAILHTAKEYGDVSHSIDTALSDGAMTARERNNVLGEISEAIEALCQLREAVNAYNTAEIHPIGKAKA